MLSEEYNNSLAYVLKRKARNKVFLISEAANGIVEQLEKRFNSFYIAFKRAFKAEYFAAKPVGTNYVETKKMPLFCGRFLILSFLRSVLVYIVIF